MKRLLAAAAVLGAVLVFSVSGLAQSPKGGAKPASPAPKAGEVKKGDAAGVMKTFDFEGDIVEAQFLRPDQGVAEVVRLVEGPSLIKIRTDFVDEILKSAEDL